MDNSLLLLESISEDGVTERRQVLSPNFVPTLQSGEWSDIGGRCYMEDTHICISDLAKNFGCSLLGHQAVSFYGVCDGHGGKSAAQFVRDHLPRVIIEDADFPLELEKVVTRSFIRTDVEFAQSCLLESSLSSGTTALAAFIFGRPLSKTVRFNVLKVIPAGSLAGGNVVARMEKTIRAGQLTSKIIF